ncbi:hypothetical protein HKD37_18G051800 [Glycine soja]
MTRKQDNISNYAKSGSTDDVIDPPSPIRRHVKWKMAHTKKTRQMMSEAAKEIAEKIVSHFQLTIVIIFVYSVNALDKYMCFVQDSLEELASQGSFVPHGRQDVLTAAIRRPEHPDHVHAVGVSVTIKQYFGSAPRTSCSSSSLPPEDLQQLTQQIRDQLEESITEKMTRPSFNRTCNHRDLHCLRSLRPRVSTKESCVDHSGNDPETGDSDKCGLYLEENSSRLVALGRVYEGSTTVHNIPLLPGQVKVCVEEVKDAEAPLPIPIDEVTLVGQALNTFLAWLTHLVKRSCVSTKTSRRSDLEVDDPMYLMTLTIPKLFLKPLQVIWDATVFGVFNQNFPLYIKHEDLSEIAHGCQCHLRNFNVYGFLEPQSIQRAGQLQFESETYIKSWMQSSKCDVYLGAYLNGSDNYLKGIINKSELFSIHLH